MSRYRWASWKRSPKPCGAAMLRIRHVDAGARLGGRKGRHPDGRAGARSRAAAAAAPGSRRGSALGWTLSACGSVAILQWTRSRFASLARLDLPSCANVVSRQLVPAARAAGLAPAFWNGSTLLAAPSLGYWTTPENREALGAQFIWIGCDPRKSCRPPKRLGPQRVEMARQLTHACTPAAVIWRKPCRRPQTWQRSSTHLC